MGTLFLSPLADNFGRKRVLIFASLISMVGYVVLLLSSSIYAIMVGIFMSGIIFEFSGRVEGSILAEKGRKDKF